MDLTDLEFETEKALSFTKTMVTPLKLKNNFYKAELEITRNDCLTLFLFLDGEENTKISVYPDQHDVHFDFRKNANNGFLNAVQGFWGHSRQSFDLVYNSLDKENAHVFLKIVCPFFSVYGDEQVDFKIKLFHKSYNFESNLLFFLPYNK